MVGWATVVTGSGVLVSIITLLVTVYIWKRSCRRTVERERREKMGQSASATSNPQKKDIVFENNRELNTTTQRISAKCGSSPPSTPGQESNNTDLRLLCDQLTIEKLQLTQQVEQLLSCDREMKSVITEYEKAMQLLIDKNASKIDEEDLEILAKEKDQALEDLENVELAFSDLHKRYEKSKSIIEALKNNEETLKSCLTDSQRKHKFQEDRYQALKDHVSEKLEKANKELEVVRRRAEDDVIVLKASLKKSELAIESLQKSLEQKKRENLELTSICEELLSKMGPQKS